LSCRFAVTLADDFKDDGFVIIGFPCNQFGGQEPGSDAQIKTFATSNYGVKPPFMLMSKIEVNGPNTHPLYEKLKSNGSRTFLSTLGGTDIKWNFGKVGSTNLCVLVGFRV
jgi:glutathione peroxidase-family protein